MNIWKRIERLLLLVMPGGPHHWLIKSHHCYCFCWFIYSGGGPSTYVYCVVCYRVIAAPYVRSVGHVFANLYTLDDDSECPMDYDTSLLHKCFLLYTITFSHYLDLLVLHKHHSILTIHLCQMVYHIRLYIVTATALYLPLKQMVCIAG